MKEGIGLLRKILAFDRFWYFILINLKSMIPLRASSAIPRNVMHIFSQKGIPMGNPRTNVCFCLKQVYHASSSWSHCAAQSPILTSVGSSFRSCLPRANWKKIRDYMYTLTVQCTLYWCTIQCTLLDPLSMPVYQMITGYKAD